MKPPAPGHTLDRPLRIPVVLGTVRQRRMSERVAALMLDRLAATDGVETELVDIAELMVPVSDAGEAVKDHDFAAAVSTSDGFVVVVPEYNHGYPGMLKHVLDSNYWEYVHRTVGLVGVSSGPIGGARAIENLVPVVKAVGLVPIVWDLNVGNVGSAFTDAGAITDSRLNGRIAGFIGEMVWMSTTLRYGRAFVPNGARMP
jgi:NAD(P)H-dependent FMN reductase